MPRFTFATCLKVLGWLLLAAIVIALTHCFPTSFLPD